MTYVLWSWALGALSILLSGTLTYIFVDKAGNFDFLIYTLATLIVLLPLAYVADRFYRKVEPEQKHGFPAVVMVLNAVIIFLVALAGLITAVIALLTMLVSPGDNSGKLITFMSAAVVATLGILLFLRIMRPAKLVAFPKLFPKIVLAIAGLTVVVSLIGPFGSEVSRRNDKLIESGLPNVNQAIQTYASNNKKLPDNLSSLSLYDKDARTLVNQNKVDYRIISQVAPPYSFNNTSGIGATILGSGSNLNGDRTGEYELCVTYKKERKATYDTGYVNSKTSINTDSHKAGRQCYDQTVTVYNY